MRALLREILEAFGLVRKVVLTRVCPSCREEFTGDGYYILGRHYCEKRCAPTAYRQGVRR